LEHTDFLQVGRPTSHIRAVDLQYNWSYYFS